MKTIAILTRDCAGVNAAIRSVVRSAAARGAKVVGIERGYEGLIAGEARPLDHRAVSGIINLGGTILKTSRSEAFRTEEGQAAALATLRRLGIEGLIVVGGNGSLAGAHVLAAVHGVPAVGIPATIDNDVSGVDAAIGADTALNVAVDALDKIRDTATSLERVFVVEVMGRLSGWLAMQVALAGGCEDVLVPEMDADMEAIARRVREGNRRGKVSWIVIVAEGRARASDVAAALETATGLETRIAVLGHIQRGGRPTAVDRLLAARLGHAAVERLLAGERDVLVRMTPTGPGTYPLEKAIAPKTTAVREDYHLLRVLS